MRIRAYLYVMAAAILVPVLLFAGLALRLLGEADDAGARAELARAAQRVALLVDDELSDVGAALHALATSPSLAHGDLAAFHREAGIAAASPSSWSVLFDENGNQLMNTLLVPGTPISQEYTPPWLPAVLARGRATVIDVTPGRVAGRLITLVALPACPGAHRCVLAMGFGTEHFQRLLAASGLPRDWQIDLVDRTGKLVASNLGNAELIGQEAPGTLLAAAATAASGLRELPLRNGAAALVAFQRAPRSGWLVAVGAPRAALDAAHGAAQRQALLALAAALACAAVVAASFVHLPSRAFDILHKAALALGRGETPAPHPARILEAERVLDALRQASVDLLRAQATRDGAGHERQSLLEREQLARQTAEEENRAKDQFLAMLGHELRNPLAPIGTAAQLLRMPDIDSHRARYAGDVIGRQVEHMNRLLSDMLDVSRVTRGLVTLNLEDVDLRNVVERAVEQIRPLLEECQHRLELRLPQQAVMARGDRTRLTQVVANLLTNSAKYTPPHGDIQVALVANGVEATLTVADDGDGIAPELMPRLFDLFSQGDRKPDRPQGGLGLGLALVRSLVQLHGGSVEASSPGRGGGSIFTVRLPLKQELAALATPALPPARTHGHAPAALRVMLVDDNIDAAVSLSLLLEAAGDHLVSTYYDATSALEWAAFERPDVFILDIGLPDMNGYELARRLRAMPQFATTLLIALTGYGQVADKIRAREAGFDLHIAKPAEPEEILDALASVRVAAEAERTS